MTSWVAWAGRRPQPADDLRGSDRRHRRPAIFSQLSDIKAPALPARYPVENARRPRTPARDAKRAERSAMFRRDVLRLLSGGAVLAAGFGLSACTYVEGYPPPVRPVRPYPVSPYEYYYYPSVNVYFHVRTGYYSYWHGGRWYRARVLPKRYYLSRFDRRRIYIRDRYPYSRNAEHRKRYREERRTPPRRERDNRAHERERRRRREARPDRRASPDGRHEARPDRRAPSDGRRRAAPDAPRAGRDRGALTPKQRAERRRRLDREERTALSNRGRGRGITRE